MANDADDLPSHSLGNSGVVYIGHEHSCDEVLDRRTSSSGSK